VLEETAYEFMERKSASPCVPAAMSWLSIPQDVAGEDLTCVVCPHGRRFSGASGINDAWYCKRAIAESAKSKRATLQER